MANQFVAFQDDRHGLGAWVAEQVAAMAFRRDADAGPGAGPSTGRAAPRTRQLATADYGLSLSGNPGATPARGGDMPESFGGAFKTWTSPRATANDTMAAVIGGKASFGVLPLFDDQGFDRETLTALMDFPAGQAVREYVASSNYVLAVPTDLIHEAEQAGFTDSFSNGGASFKWTAEKQAKYRKRVSTVLASADALRHCGSAIQGLRAKGIDVQQVPDGIDTYREGLRVAASLLDPERQVETRFGTEGHQRRSKTRGANAHKGLVAVLLTLDKAIEGGYAYDADYTVLEAEMAGADAVRTSYLAIGKRQAGGARVKDPLRASMAAIHGALAADPHAVPTVGGPDHRMSRGFGREGAPTRGSSGYGATLARVLWKVNTTGTSSGGSGRMNDYSGVLAALTRGGVPHKVTHIEGREGNPVVIAFDVRPGHEKTAQPAIRALLGIKGSQMLATFPATQALVPDDLLPRREDGRGALRTLGGIVGVLTALGAFLAWRYVSGG